MPADTFEVRDLAALGQACGRALPYQKVSTIALITECPRTCRAS